MKCDYWKFILSSVAALSIAACSADDERDVAETSAQPSSPTQPDDVAPAKDNKAPESEKPPLITIDDLDFLGPVEFTTTEFGLRATPVGEAPDYSIAFLLPEGAYAENYKNFAQFIAGKGNGVYVINGGVSPSVFDNEHNEESCTLVGGIAAGAYEALKYGYDRLESVDGAILVGFALDNEKEQFKKRMQLVLVAGGQDGVTPYEKAAGQFSQFPSQTYLMTVKEANHSNYFDDAQNFPADGEALVPWRQQRLILGEVTSNMMDRLCRTRERRIADAERKAAREAEKAED